MSYAKGELKRSSTEKLFLWIFIPAVFIGYSYYKYPEFMVNNGLLASAYSCLLYTSPSPRDRQKSRMPSSA